MLQEKKDATSATLAPGFSPSICEKTYLSATPLKELNQRAKTPNFTI